MYFVSKDYPWSYNQAKNTGWIYKTVERKRTADFHLPIITRTADYSVAVTKFDSSGERLPFGKCALWVKSATKESSGIPVEIVSMWVILGFLLLYSLYAYFGG